MEGCISCWRRWREGYSYSDEASSLPFSHLGRRERGYGLEGSHIMEEGKSEGKSLDRERKEEGGREV